MTDPTPAQPHAPSGPALIDMGSIAQGVWITTPPDDQGLPGFVRVDAITAITAWATETTGRVEVRHDSSEATVVARVTISPTAKLSAVAKAEAIRAGTALAAQVVAGMLAPLLGPTLDYRTDDAGAPGGGA